MSILQQLVIQILSREACTVEWKGWDMEQLAQRINHDCLGALGGIRAVLDNDQLSDSECIEEIVCILEGIGSNGGSRHDFS